MAAGQKRLRLLSFAYLVLVLISLTALIFLSGKDLARIDPAREIYADFLGYYRSAKIVLSADRQKIYDRETQLLYFNNLNASKKSSEFIYSQNPPTFLLVISPFALLPLELSFKLWIALSLLSTAVALALLAKLLKEKNWIALSLLAICAGVLSAPGWICLLVGQMSWFICFFTVLFYLGFVSKKDWLCGFALSLVTAKFQYLFLLAMPVLAHKRWKTLAWAAAIEAILLLISALVFGPANIINYPSLLAQAETTKDYSGVFPEYMISLRGIFSLFVDRQEALAASSLLMFISLVPIYLLWQKQARLEKQESSAWAMSITICTALFFSAHTHIYDDILLLLPACLTVPYMLARLCKANKDEPTLSFAEKIWLVGLLSFPFLSWLLFVYCSNNEFIKRTPFAALNALFLLCACAGFLRELRSRTNSETVGTNTDGV